MNLPTPFVLSLKSRHRFAAIAGAFLVITSISISFPHGIEKRQRLETANKELLSLQSDITSTQNRIREIQNQILAEQLEIKKALRGRK